MNQEKWVINQLLHNGEVTRNGALQMFISRLGAIVCNLQKNGWTLRGEYRKEKNGKDFVYYLVSTPFKKVEYFVPALNKTVTNYESK